MPMPRPSACPPALWAHGRCPSGRFLRCPAAAAHDDEEFFDEADTEIVETIKELIETRVRPAVAQDGGDITFRGFENGTVFLHMKGACSGCPSSTATLKHGIQNLLRHFVPEVQQVEQI